MAKTPMRCPFNEQICEECQLYRGRHYYLCTCENYRGYIKPRNKVKINGHIKQYDMETIKKMFEPWSSERNNNNKASEPKLKLKVIEMESGVSKYVEPDEAKMWKWGDPNIMRVVNGGHVTSWETLSEIIRYQAEQGTKELVIYEAPRFMLLGGG